MGLAGLEPATFTLWVCYSNLLSYRPCYCLILSGWHHILFHSEYSKCHSSEKGNIQSILSLKHSKVSPSWTLDKEQVSSPTLHALQMYCFIFVFIFDSGIYDIISFFATFFINYLWCLIIVVWVIKLVLLVNFWKLEKVGKLGVDVVHHFSPYSPYLHVHHIQLFKK